MNFLEELYRERQELARVLSNPEYSGIREIVEDLYPDRAHFIFELLQNAEDAGATEARFILEEQSLSFEHNGRDFNESDVRGITNIGKGTKKDQEDKIGRFGVGFKAVFAYSETPHIWSPSFSFKISDLVLPAAINVEPSLGQKTRFWFPFNNPKKPAPDAFTEVKAGLEELAETTLLFLTNLNVVRWQVGKQAPGEILRIEHSENHVEAQKRTGRNTTVSSHFLRFSELVEGLEKQSLGIAFALDFLPNVDEFDSKEELDKQVRVIPANPGRVAVFFPAEKETSGLRFHLQAPFVPELSRASIKETAANEPLFEQLAKLTAASLFRIRDLNLLTIDFLTVLPNPQDPIPPRYQRIRSTVIAEMNAQPLTPTNSKSFAPARHLLQAKASLKDLLSAEDLKVLHQYSETPPQWAVAASQKNSSADRFLSGLAIKEWDVDMFIELLNVKASDGQRFLQAAPWVVNGPEEKFMTWLASKPPEWHQQFYGLLRAELPANPAYRRKQAVDNLKCLRIVRVSDGTYSVGDKCFFPSDGVEQDEILPRVDITVYSSGKSKTQQEEAKKFLEEIGVREVGETEQIQAILNHRYTARPFNPDMKDLDRFIALIEKDPRQAKIFSDYFIFKREDGKWGKPAQVYLDSPWLETGLSHYYKALGTAATCVALSETYQDAVPTPEKLISFAVKVGVKNRLEIKKASCRDNPAADYLALTAPGGWSSSYGIDQDYTIAGLKELLTKNNESLSQLIWRTACEMKGQDWLVAKYRNNSNQQIRESPSQIVCLLRESAWIPQTTGEFLRPSEASRFHLPKGFPFDEGYEWLKAIRFGDDEKRRSEEHKKKHTTAKELGFSDAETLERARQFAAIPKADQERVLAEFQRRPQTELPEHEPANAERRAERVAQQAAEAPERLFEIRSRSVSVNRDEVKQETEPYLREQYTNAAGEMICQICKAPLPFKLGDGNYYFEKVEFLDELTKHHHQNYLALCPNHGAMFRHANGTKGLKQLFLEMLGNRLELVLADEAATIYFTKTHIADMRTVISADRAGEMSDDDGAITS